MTELEQKAEDLTQQYFQQFGGITCNWDNVRKIIQERLEVEFYLGEKNAELQKKYDELNDFSNSQCAKLLKENAELKKKIEGLEIENKKLKICSNCNHLKDTMKKLYSCENCKDKSEWEPEK